MGTQERIQNPYEQFARAELILRDQLAIDRTILANERTLLAYLRTGLALIVTGTGLFKLFEGPLVPATAIVLITFGVAIAVFGFSRFVTINKSIRTVGCMNHKGAQQCQDVSGSQPQPPVAA